MEKEWIRKSGDTRRKIAGKFKNMFVSDIEANNVKVSSIASIKSTTETQERVANFKEGGDQREPSVELSERDKRVKKVCERVFWGYFVCFLLSFIISVEYTVYIISFLFSYVIISIGFFFGYWKFIRKEPIPDWFKTGSNRNWNESTSFGYKSSESKSFATDPRYSSSPSSIFYRI
jgi:hypothetical protein